MPGGRQRQPRRRGLDARGRGTLLGRGKGSSLARAWVAGAALPPACLLSATRHPAFPGEDAGKERQLRREKTGRGWPGASRREANRVPRERAFPLSGTVSRSLAIKLIYCAEIISVAGELI